MIAVLTIAGTSGMSVWKMSATMTKIITKQEIDSSRIDKIEKDGSSTAREHIIQDNQRFEELKCQFEELRKEMRDVPSDIRWIKKYIEDNTKKP